MREGIFRQCIAKISRKLGIWYSGAIMLQIKQTGIIKGDRGTELTPPHSFLKKGRRPSHYELHKLPGEQDPSPHFTPLP